MKRFFCVCLLLIMCLCSGASAVMVPVPEAGDVITFGHYEQDNVTENGPEPIEWIVLEVQDGKAWLMSKYCLETVIFYPERIFIYWATSNLRPWMNNEFLNAAFSPEEQELILTTTVKNDNPHGKRHVGDDTEDKIYLLSYDEVLHFMPELEDRIAYPTPYAIAQGCTLGDALGSCRWWTRTPGARDCDVCGVRVDGRMTKYGMQDVDWPGNTMRPVMWIRVGE